MNAITTNNHQNQYESFSDDRLTKNLSEDCPLILIDFNINQLNKQNILDDKLKRLRMKTCKLNRTGSTPFLNDISRVRRYVKE